VRPLLLGLFRTACVRRDEMGQAVLLNLLLANYLRADLYEQVRVGYFRLGLFIMDGILFLVFGFYSLC